MSREWSKADDKGLSRFVTEEAITLLPISMGDRLQLLQTPDGRLELIREIYEALITKQINYAFEKYQPEEATQFIRTPSEILEAPKEGTCLDLALLFCGLCFGYDLLPLIILLEGHALAAVSLTQQRSEWEVLAPPRTYVKKQQLLSTEADLVQLRTWIKNGQYVAIECTGFARTQSFKNSSEPEAKKRNNKGYLYFDKAIEAGKEQLNSQTRKFEYAIDLAVARYYWKLKPINGENSESIPEPKLLNASNVKGDKDISGKNIFSNLPYTGTLHFVGRDETLKQLHEQLEQNNQLAICAVSGMGGIGKTELAVQYALQYQDEYQGGLCWLQCRGVDLGTQITNYGRSILELVIPDGLELLAQVAYCWQHWSEGKVLFIYDDVVDYKAIASYLPPRNKEPFKVLMTSRIKPNPVSGIENISLSVLDENSALNLLRSLVGDDEKPSEQKRIAREIEIARQLCEWLGYLPLGLELVGSYLAQSEDMELRELWEELNDERLETEALNGIEGELRTPMGVIKAFQLSWQSLSEQAKELGYRLSLFATADMAWEWVEQLFPEDQSKNVRKIRDQQLLKFSLLQRTGKKTYKLHPLIREFFRAKQEEIENINECKKALCKVMVAIAKKIPPTLTCDLTTSISLGIPHLKEVAENLIHWVCDEDLIYPYVGLERFYESQSAFTKAEECLKNSIIVVQNRLGEEHLYMATSFNNLALLYKNRESYSEAKTLYEKALAIYKKILPENHEFVATIYNNLASLYGSIGNYTEAKKLCWQALYIYLGELKTTPKNVGTIYSNLASLYESMKNYDKAEYFYLKALNIYKNTENSQFLIATCNNNLAYLYKKTKKYSNSEKLYHQALKIYKENFGENHYNVAVAYRNLAELYYELGQYSNLIEYCNNAVKIAILSCGKDSPVTIKIQDSCLRMQTN